MSLPIINDRLDLVEEMIEYPQLRQSLTALLENTFDSLRLVTKFTYGRGDADDLMELSKTIATSREIAKLLLEHSKITATAASDPTKESQNAKRKQCVPMLERRFDLEQPHELERCIQAAIDEEGLSEYHRMQDEKEDEMSD
jgi:DNA mismatch repair ATPase MutS